MARTVVITKQGIPGSAATGYSPGGTDVAVTDGGTGASSAAAARTNLGLGNVDNTSDANKPVSTAQAAADAALDSRLDVLEDDTGWILPTLASGVSVQGVWSHRGYRRIRGILYFDISLSVAVPAVDHSLFTLPADFRPAIGSGLILLVGLGGSGQVRLRPDGTVKAHSAVASFIGTLTTPIT